MKKQMIGFLAIGLGLSLLSGKALAEESQSVLLPSEDLYKTSRIMESVEFELTNKPVNKALLQAEITNERLKELESVLKNGDIKQAGKLINDYNVSLTSLNELIKKAESNNANKLVLTKSDLLSNDILTKHSEHLMALLQQYDLPDQAKQGIEKAIQNQAIAYRHFVDAKAKQDDQQPIDEKQVSEDDGSTTTQDNQTSDFVQYSSDNSYNGGSYHSSGDEKKTYYAPSTSHKSYNETDQGSQNAQEKPDNRGNESKVKDDQNPVIETQKANGETGQDSKDPIDEQNDGDSTQADHSQEPTNQEEATQSDTTDDAAQQDQGDQGENETNAHPSDDSQVKKTP